MPKGITQFPFQHFLSPRHDTVWGWFLYLTPHFSFSSSPSWVVLYLIKASDSFPAQSFLHFGLVARWLCLCQGQTVRGQSCNEAAQVFWIGETDFFNENIAREKRLRDNIFPKSSRQGKSHNGALTMQRLLLVFEATSVLCKRWV